jgi:hypothetical protein
MEQSSSWADVVAQLLQEFFRILWNSKVLPLFTTARPWTLSSASQIQSLPSIPISVLMLGKPELARPYNE